MLVVSQVSHIYKTAMPAANQVNGIYLFAIFTTGILAAKAFLFNKSLANIFAFLIAEIITKRQQLCQ